MTRAALIAKLRDVVKYLIDGEQATILWLTRNEIDRVIDDLEYCDFAHKALEGGELPQTLKKQAG